MTSEKQNAEDTKVSGVSVVELMNHPRPQLFPRKDNLTLGEMLGILRKEPEDLLEKSEKKLNSAQDHVIGEQPPPFDMHRAAMLQAGNTHHAVCIKTKVAATIGQGFRTANETPETAMENLDLETKVERVLNPLCESSFQETLSDSGEDFFQAGGGYLEVVRRGHQIVALHHIPAYQVRVVLEENFPDRHYVVKAELCGGSQDRRFALFGDKESFLARWKDQKIGAAVGDAPTNPDKVSELISLRNPTSLSRWYGFPCWLSCVPSIELTQAYYQWKFDFFQNRGVPDFLLFALGGQVDLASWNKIEAALKANIGRGNAHKSLAINIPKQDISIQVEKLASEGDVTDDFTKITDALALNIVSAHQVPPLLAGIQIPGKLGAVNELPNSLLAFHSLVAYPAQRIITQVLRSTLAHPDPKVRGGLDLEPNDFRFRRIIDTINFQNADTVSRMRTPAAAAEAEGRDIRDGLRD